MLRYANVYQDDVWDCGRAAAVNAFRLHGIELENARQLTARLGDPHNGTDPVALEHTFRRYGFPTNLGEMDLDLLDFHAARRWAVIALVQFGGTGHYVMYRGRAGGRVHYFDPSRGPKAQAELRFVAAWSDWTRQGIVLHRFAIAVGPKPPQKGV